MYVANPKAILYDYINSAISKWIREWYRALAKTNQLLKSWSRKMYFVKPSLSNNHRVEEVKIKLHTTR
jgi:hypothetical protein